LICFFSSGLGENNRANEALKFFEQMLIIPNEYTYSILFKICAQLSDHQSFEFGQAVWKKISVHDRTNPIVSTSFLQMLIKHKPISTCEQFFSQIKKNNITFTTMMKGYLSHQMPQKAIDLFYQIDKPDEITTTIFFNACTELKDMKALILAQKIFSQLPRQSHHLLQSIFNMFCRCNDISNAEIIFNQIDRDVIAYGSLMKAYNDQNQSEKTLKLYERMKQENIEGNSIIFVLVINACANIHFLSLCQSIVKQIPYNLINDRWIQTSLVDMWVSYCQISIIHLVFRVNQVQ
jgi:pentatricopeptide repeat protein